MSVEVPATVFVGADELETSRSEGSTIARCTDLSSLLEKSLPMRRFAEVLELPGMDEFVSNRSGELRPTVFFVGSPGKCDRDLFGKVIVLTTTCIALCSFGEFQVD